MTPGAWAPPSPEQVETNIRILRQLHGADHVDPIVEVVVGSKQVALLECLGLREHPDAHVQASMGHSRMLTPKIEAALFKATIPGGLLDPAHLGCDVVWVMAIKAVLVVDPARASKLARRWFAHLTRIAWEHAGTYNSVMFAVAGYSVAFLEHMRGRSHQARRWAREADTHVEHESPEMGVLAFLRACRLWVGGTGRSGKDPAFKSASLCFLGSRSVRAYVYQILTYTWIEPPHPLVFSGAGWTQYGNSDPAALLAQKG